MALWLAPPRARKCVGVCMTTPGRHPRALKRVGGVYDDARPPLHPRHADRVSTTTPPAARRPCHPSRSQTRGECV
jgi:hypothetical protein